MAVSKKDEFNESEREIANFAKALSHPARISILKMLAKQNQCICGEIVEILPLSQSTVSQHLKELKKIGIISGTIDGPRSCYCINWNNFKKYAESFEKLIKKTIINNKKCCQKGSINENK